MPDDRARVRIPPAGHHLFLVLTEQRILGNPVSDIETAVSYSRELEAILERKFAATGKGLHEKISSVEGTLPAAALPELRRIATLRNKVVHEADFRLPDLKDFTATYRSVRAQLGEPLEPVVDRSLSRRMLLAWAWLVCLAALAVILHGFYVGHIGRGFGVGVGIVFAGMIMCSDEAISCYVKAGELVLGLVVLSLMGYAGVTIWEWVYVPEKHAEQAQAPVKKTGALSVKKCGSCAPGGADR
jgi:hypothetical protein